MQYVLFLTSASSDEYFNWKEFSQEGHIALHFHSNLNYQQNLDFAFAERFDTLDKEAGSCVFDPDADLSRTQSKDARVFHSDPYFPHGFPVLSFPSSRSGKRNLETANHKSKKTSPVFAVKNREVKESSEASETRIPLSQRVMFF